MTFLFIILLIITCAVLAFFVLIQNPKGGGLSGSFGGFGNQMMGAKQSTDVVEKGTWVAAAALLVLTLGSFIMTPKNNANPNEKTRSEKLNKGIAAPQAPAPAPAPAPENTQTAPAPDASQQGAPAPASMPPANAPAPAPGK